jgi:hypothetical protein
VFQLKSVAAAHGIELSAADKQDKTSIVAAIEKLRFRDQPQLRLTRTAEHEEDEPVAARKRKPSAPPAGERQRRLPSLCGTQALTMTHHLLHVCVCVCACVRACVRAGAKGKRAKKSKSAALESDSDDDVSLLHLQQENASNKRNPGKDKQKAKGKARKGSDQEDDDQDCDFVPDA